MTPYNLIGKRFGRLVGISRAEKHPRYGQSRWLFRCDCGTEKVLFGYSVVHGTVQSCGCLQRQRLKENRTKHGRCNTPEWRVWISMRRRCEVPSDPAYPLYGGRGIAVCSRWQYFLYFLEDMGKRPVGMTLDRIDNDGPYSPENCRWASRKQQVRNRRTTMFETIGGVKLSLQEWAEKICVSYGTIWQRHLAGDRGQRLIRPLRGAPE